MLAPSVETEIADLAMRYGQPQRVVAELTGALFDPLTMNDRYGEVCMVVRRPNGKLISAIKTFYPAGAFRLLTGGVDHGELIADALLREVAEETGLDVAVRRFLAVIEYRSQGLVDAEGGVANPPPASSLFATFAFLLDEIGGVLQVQDPNEQIGAFRELAVDELPAQAETLEHVPDTYDQAIGGSWSDWGRFRAVVHRVVYAALANEGL